MSMALVPLGTRMRHAFDVIRGRAEPGTFGPWDASRGWTRVRGVAPTDYSTTGANVRRLGWERHPVVQSCVRITADVVGYPGIEVYRRAAGRDADIAVLETGPAVELFRAPRAGMSPRRLAKLTAAHFLLYGNAFWVLERASRRGPPTGIRLIHPEWINYVYLDQETEEILQWQWRDRHGRIRPTPARDMVHFADLSGDDWLFGFPRAAAALTEMATDREASAYVRSIVLNDGAAGTAFIMEPQVSPDSAKTAEERWHEKKVMRGERGRTAFMAGVKDVKVIGFNLQQLEFPDLRLVTREGICTAFGVDPRMVGIASARGNEGGLSGQQYAEARFRHIQQTCLPLMGDLEAQLDLWLMPEFGDVYARFSPERLAELTLDEEQTSQRVTRELQAGARTREEGRRTLGLPEAMNPSHTLIGTLSRTEYPVSMQFDRVEADLAASEAATEAIGREADEEENEPAARPKAASGDASRIVKRGVKLTPTQRVELWRAFDTRATREEATYNRAALLLFQNERSAVTAAFDRFLGGRADGDDAIIGRVQQLLRDAYGEDGDFYRAWAERYRGLISTTVSTAGEELASQFGLSFTLDNSRVLKAIQLRVATLADYVTETTAKEISAAIATGRAAGMSLRDVAKLVQESALGGGHVTARARLIARTETIGALNHGELLAAQESGGALRSKEWLTQGDSKVRRAHRELDGQRRALDEPFSSGLHFPSEPNCRCTLLFSDEEAE